MTQFDFEGDHWVERDLILNDGTYRVLPVTGTSIHETRWGAGRKSYVYKLVDQQGQPWALKVLHRRYAVFKAIANTIRLNSWAHLPGLRVCRRRVIDVREASNAGAPGLRFSVLMPWIDGIGWQDLVQEQRLVPQNECERLALATASVVAGLEQNRLAHGDLASANVIVVPSSESSAIELIDVEDMYHPEFDDVPEQPDGSDGYIHPANLGRGTRNRYGDRFAGAILISEMLVWHVDEIRREAVEDSLFRQEELGRATRKYYLVRSTLRTYSTDLVNLFTKAWTSEGLSQCPPLSEWAAALRDLLPGATTAQSDHDRVTVVTTPTGPGDADSPSRTTSVVPRPREPVLDSPDPSGDDPSEASSVVHITASAEGPDAPLSTLAAVTPHSDEAYLVKLLEQFRSIYHRLTTGGSVSDGERDRWMLAASRVTGSGRIGVRPLHVPEVDDLLAAAKLIAQRLADLYGVNVSIEPVDEA